LCAARGQGATRRGNGTAKMDTPGTVCRLYAANQKGFYAEENIEVTIKAGGPNISPDQAFTDLIAGETAFTIQGGDQVIAARAQGKPIVAIAVVFQKNPHVYIST